MHLNNQVINSFGVRKCLFNVSRYRSENVQLSHITTWIYIPIQLLKKISIV